MANRTLADLNRLAPNKVKYRHPFSGDALTVPGVRLGTNGVRFNTVPRNVISDINMSVQDMATNGSVIVAVGAGSVSGGTTSTAGSSTDGATWTARTLPAAADWHSVVWTGVRFLASNNGGGNSAVSTDGATWSAGPTLPGTGLKIYAFAGLLIGFLATAGTTYYTSADDGATWTTRTFPVSIGADRGKLAVGITATAMVLVVGIPSGASWANLVYRTTNGTSWSAQTVPPCQAPAAGAVVVRMLSNGARFSLMYYANGSAGGPLFVSNSLDGITWGDFQSVVPIGIDAGNGNVGGLPGNQAGAMMANNTVIQSMAFATRGYLGSRYGVIVAILEYDANAGSTTSRLSLCFLHTIDGTNWVLERAFVNGNATTTQNSFFGASVPLPSGDGFAFGFMTANSGTGSVFCRTNPNFMEFSYVP